MLSSWTSAAGQNGNMLVDERMLKSGLLRALPFRAQVCREQGVRFVPLVVETTGAWEPQAAKVLVHVARAAAVREGSDPSTLHAELTQDLCATVRSFRARAALRRRAELATEASGAAARLAAAALMAG